MGKRQINYDNDKKVTAQRLREAMNDANMNATFLSAKSKVSKSSISQYLHGLQSPSNITAAALAKVLDVDPVWLMGFDVSKERKVYDDQNKRLMEYYKRISELKNVADIFSELPQQGKDEMISFAQYLRTKYKPLEKESQDEREHNKEENQ